MNILKALAVPVIFASLASCVSVPSAPNDNSPMNSPSGRMLQLGVNFNIFSTKQRSANQDACNISKEDFQADVPKFISVISLMAEANILSAKHRGDSIKDNFIVQAMVDVSEMGVETAQQQLVAVALWKRKLDCN